MGDQDFIQSILSSIDAEEFVKAVGFHSELTRVLGRSIKTPCMVHRDSAFASLIIDAEKKTYKCMKAGCAANSGGNLVQLYALYTGQSVESAALGVAELLNISVDDSAVEEILEQERQIAEEAIQAENWSQLKESVETFEKLKGHHTEVVYWRALLAEQGMPEVVSAEELIGHWEKAQDSMRMTNAKRSLEILRLKLIPAVPERVDLLFRKSELEIRVGELENAQTSLVEYVLKAKEMGAPLDKSSMELIHRETFRAHSDVSLLAAGVYAEAGESQKSRELYLLTHECLMEQDKKIEALSALGMAALWEPADSELVMRVYGELKFESQDRGLAYDFLEDCCERLLKKGNAESALTYVRQLLQDDVKRIEPWDLLLSVYHALGDMEGAAEALLQKCELVQITSHLEQEELKALESCSAYFVTLPQLIRLCGVYYEAGLKDSASALSTRILELLNEGELGTEQLETWKRLFIFFPQHEKVLIGYLHVLLAMGERAQWKSMVLAALGNPDYPFDVLQQLTGVISTQFAEDLELQFALTELLWGCAESDESREEVLCAYLRLAKERKSLDAGRKLFGWVRNQIEALPSVFAEEYIRFLISLKGANTVGLDEARLIAKSDCTDMELILSSAQFLSGTEEMLELLQRATRLLSSETKPDIISTLLKLWDDALDTREGVQARLVCLRLLGTEEKLLEELDRALALFSKSKDSVDWLNELFQQRLRLAPDDLNTLENYRSFLKKEKRSAEAIQIEFTLASLLEKCGDTDGAARLVSQVMKENPKDPLVRRRAVTLLRESGNEQEVTQTLGTIAEELFAQKNYAEALATWREVWEAGGRNGVVGSRYFECLLMILHPKDADLELGLELYQALREEFESGFRVRLLEYFGKFEHMAEGVYAAVLNLLDEQDFDAEYVDCRGLLQFAMEHHYLDLGWKLGRELDLATLHDERIIGFIKSCAQDSGNPNMVFECEKKLIGFLIQRGDSTGLMERIERLFSEAPRDLEVREFYARKVVIRSNREEAFHFNLESAQLAIEFGEGSAARDILDRLVNENQHEAMHLEEIAKVYAEARAEGRAVELLTRAMELHLENECSELALEVLERVVTLLPEDRFFRKRKAELLRELDRFEVAVLVYEELLEEVETADEEVDILQRILELYPKKTDRRKRLAELFLSIGNALQAAEQFSRVHQALLETVPEQAKELRLRLEKELDDQPKIVALLFQAALDENDFVRSLKWGQVIVEDLKSKGYHGEAIQVLVRIKEVFGEEDEAILRLETTLEGTNPGVKQQTSPRIKLARKLSKEGRINEAIQELEPLLDEPEWTLVASRTIIPLYIKSNQFELAQRRYLVVLNELLGMGNVEEALLLQTQLFHLDAQNPQLREQVALIFLRNSIPEVAADQFSWIAKNSLEEKRFKDALAWGLKALDAAPRSIEGRILLALIYERLENVPDATAQYLKAAELLVEAGLFEKAAYYVEQICRLTPESPEPREQLIKLYEQIGQGTQISDQLDRLVRIYGKQHRNDDHLRILRRMVSLHPDQTQYRGQLIEVLKTNGVKEELFQNLILQSDLQVMRGRKQEAVGLLGEALDYATEIPGGVKQVLDQIREHGSSEEYIRFALQQAEKELQQGNVPGTQVLLNSVSTMAQKNAGYFLLLASLYEATNQTTLAKQALDKVEALVEESASLEEKILAYKKLLERVPDHCSIWRSLIHCYRISNRLEEATLAQQELAFRLAHQGRHEDVVMELRTLLQMDPENLKAWEQLIESTVQFSPEKNLVEDYLVYAGLLMESRKYMKALEIISRVIRLEPYHVDARMAYVRAFLKVGMEEELIEDYLTIADLLVSNNRLDDAIHYFNKVTTIDPSYKDVQLRMTQTQRMKRGRDSRGHSELLQNPDAKRPHEETGFRQRTERPTETQLRSSGDRLSARTEGAARVPSSETETGLNPAHQFLMDEMEAMEREDELAELRQIIQNYQDILSINPQNANVRVKLAHHYLQMDDKQKALKEYAEARDLYFNKGEIATCIEVCEKMLELHPTDQRTRLVLKQSLNKRDAFKALESAIIYSDTNDDTKRPPKK
jgi:tetratricopeptide (TPR) repeat protein